MAKQSKDDAEQTETKGGKGKLIAIVAVAVLLLVGGGVVATLMLLGGTDEQTAADGQDEPAVVKRGDPYYVRLDPAFTVNLPPGDDAAYLQIGLEMLTYEESVRDALELHKPSLRNNLGMLFGGQSSRELRTLEGKERLRQAVLDEVHSLLASHGGEAQGVEGVYFTSFVMQ